MKFSCFFRDLKPNNIVLTRDGEVRLIDFGHTTIFPPNELEILPSQIARYSSPEVWNKQPAGHASDWWAYGVIIAYLYQLKLPFDGDTKEEIQKKVQSGEPDIEEIQPAAAKEFVSKLLVINPADRPTQVSSDKLFDTLKTNAPKTPFKPGTVKYVVEMPSTPAEYATDDPTIYGQLEAGVTRIPSTQFLNSEYFKSL